MSRPACEPGWYRIGSGSLKGQHFRSRGTDAQVFGKSWKQLPVTTSYVGEYLRRARADAIPLDGVVYFGEIGALASTLRLIHETEMGEAL